MNNYFDVYWKGSYWSVDADDVSQSDASGETCYFATVGDDYYGEELVDVTTEFLAFQEEC